MNRTLREPGWLLETRYIDGPKGLYLFLGDDGDNEEYPYMVLTPDSEVKSYTLSGFLTLFRTATQRPSANEDMQSMR